MARSWYGYLSTGDVTDPGNYFLTSVKPSCITGDNICAIYAPEGGALPLAPFSKRMLQYIADASTGTVARPNVAGAKFYLYKKD
ncbi:hypothetical protein [Pedobacter sp. NJ-S-72]